MPWSDLTLTAATLKGIAPVDLTDSDFDTHDSERITADRLSQAKRYIQMRLMRDIPQFIEKTDGPAEFLDAVIAVGKAHLNDLLQMMLGYAVLFHYYEQEAISSNTIYEDKGMIMRKYFEEAFNAFSVYIRLDKDVLQQSQTTAEGTVPLDAGVTWVG